MVIQNPQNIMPGSMQRTQRNYLTISSAQLLALNAMPIILAAAPGVGKTLSFEKMLIHKPAGTAYAGIAAGEDLAVKYTDGSGLEVAQCETTGFLDQATNQIRVVNAHAAASGASQITPVENAPLVLHLLVGEIITGDSPLNCEVLYTILDTTPAAS